MESTQLSQAIESARLDSIVRRGHRGGQAGRHIHGNWTRAGRCKHGQVDTNAGIWVQRGTNGRINSPYDEEEMVVAIGGVRPLVGRKGTESQSGAAASLAAIAAMTVVMGNLKILIFMEGSYMDGRIGQR